MLEARRAGWFRFAFRVLDAGRPVGSVEFRGWGESGLLTFGTRRLTVRREGWWNPRFVLEEQGRTVARAGKKSAFQRGFELVAGDIELELVPTSLFLGSYELRARERRLGALRARGFFGRRIELDLPEVMPLELRLFTLWLAALQWRRAAAQS